MATEKLPRENLLRDAKGFGKRAQICLCDSEVSGEGKRVAETVFLGLKDSGAWSVYFEEDPVFQFDAHGRLRRVFIDGHKFAAKARQLVKLEQRQAGGRVVLEWHPLADRDEVHLVVEFQRRLEGLARSLDAGDFSVEGAEPADWDGFAVGFNLRITKWCQDRAIAEDPNS